MASMQKVVILSGDGSSTLAQGDPDREPVVDGGGSDFQGKALPLLLTAGWRVVSLAAPNSNGMSVLLLEKGNQS